MAKEPQEYIDLWKELDRNFQPRRSDFKEVTAYVLPGRGKYIDQGELPIVSMKDRRRNILTGLASRCLKFAAAGIHGYLTSEARPWFRLVPDDIKLLKSSAVRVWLQDLETLFYSIYSKTNFYQSVHTVYQEELGFGTGVILQEEDPDKVCRFYVLTAGEYRIATNYMGQVDTVARLFYMTARQMEQRFGYDVLSKDIQNTLKDKPNKSFKVLNIVRPNKNREYGKVDSKNLPFESCYVEYEGEQNILEKKGYHENPYACPRWDIVADDPYGDSPTYDLLGEIKTLQVQRKDLMQAMHKTLDPPMKIPTTMKDTLDMMPGGQNWVDPNSMEYVKPLYQINFDIQSTKMDMKEVMQDIREGYFNDFFLMISQSPGIQPKNEMEIMGLQEEKLIMLGPVIGRQFSEFLTPLMTRTMNIAWRNGLIPPPPPELQGAEIKVEYVSILAQAQKKIGTQVINSTVGFIANLAAAFPAAADKLNIDETVDVFAELNGSPQQMINDENEVAAIREARQKQIAMQQAQQAMDVMATGGKAAKAMAGADTSGQNALTDIMKGMGVQTGQTGQPNG